MKKIIYTLMAVVLISSCCCPKPGQRWSQEKAEKWYEDHGWVAGCNFTPSTAINQLEMWQAETFDPETIDRELGWAEELGFNCMRVFLHHVAWEVDQEGFKDRMNKYLEIYKELAKIEGLDIVASGGITFIDEIKTLNSMNIYGAILGKAIYEGKLDLKEALVAAGGIL